MYRNLCLKEDRPTHHTKALVRQASSVAACHVVIRDRLVGLPRTAMSHCTPSLCDLGTSAANTMHDLGTRQCTQTPQRVHSAPLPASIQ